MKHKTAPTISLAGWFTTDRTVDAAEVPKTGTIPADVWVTGAPLLWNSQTPVRGTGVIVGVIDSGIDDAHPDLRGKVLFRKDYVKDGASPDKFNLHGTHVAGTIAANGKVLGVAPGAVLHDYRVLGQDGSGSLDSITQAVRDGVKHGCNILNLSLGGPSDYPPLHQAIKAAVQAGVLVVCSAGNEGEGAIGYPAFYEEVVSVGAVDFNSSTGRIDKLDFPSQNEEVDVAADGYQVFSTVPGGKYAFLSGTSMASPHVAGFAALMLNKLRVMQALPRSFQSGLGSTIEPILYTLIKESTVDILGKGIDWGSGAGFVTWYPAVPTKDPNGEWVLPGMELGFP